MSPRFTVRCLTCTWTLTRQSAGNASALADAHVHGNPQHATLSYPERQPA